MDSVPWNLMLKSPIRQHAEGANGIYTVTHLEGKSMRLGRFREIAEQKQYLAPLDDDIPGLMKRFWKMVRFCAPMYGADTPGTLSDETAGSWYLPNLPNLLNRLLKKRIPGVNTPYLYVGMWRASFAWHTEDYDLSSINYLHFGAPKVWYCVPPEFADKVERLAATLFPQSFRECKQFLRHKSSMIEPDILIRHGIPVSFALQNPNDFMILFPRAFHCGFNTGFNCAESCNFADEKWIEIGRLAKACSCRKDMVRLDLTLLDGLSNCLATPYSPAWNANNCLTKPRKASDPWATLPLEAKRSAARESVAAIVQAEAEASGLASGDEDDEQEGCVRRSMASSTIKGSWLQCDQCLKWRRLPAGEGNQTLAESTSFNCSMLPHARFPSQFSAPPVPGSEGSDMKTEGVTRGWTCEDDEENWTASSGSDEITGLLGESNEEGNDTWCQCEKCDKWRRLPLNAGVDASGTFFCSMLSWMTCDVPEECWDEESSDSPGTAVTTLDSPGIAMPSPFPSTTITSLTASASKSQTKKRGPKKNYREQQDGSYSSKDFEWGRASVVAGALPQPQSLPITQSADSTSPAKPSASPRKPRRPRQNGVGQKRGRPPLTWLQCDMCDKWRRVDNKTVQMLVSRQPPVPVPVHTQPGTFCHGMPVPDVPTATYTPFVLPPMSTYTSLAGAPASRNLPPPTMPMTLEMSSSPVPPATPLSDDLTDMFLWMDDDKSIPETCIAPSPLPSQPPHQNGGANAHVAPMTMPLLITPLSSKTFQKPKSPAKAKSQSQGSGPPQLSPEVFAAQLTSLKFVCTDMGLSCSVPEKSPRKRKQIAVQVRSIAS
mmetsp:Transcript_45335/g.73846  ORF Transcript_45335/g.73846 Transcript_45335/m.73846 type:complete len:829 (-) Transcript_45335:204-2690(-)